MEENILPQGPGSITRLTWEETDHTFPTEVYIPGSSWKEQAKYVWRVCEWKTIPHSPVS